MNIVERMYAMNNVYGQRRTIIDNYVKQLQEVNSPRVIRQQHAFLQSLEVSLRDLGRDATKISTTLRKQDTDYITSVIDADQKIYTARQNASAKMAEAKLKHTENARKFIDKEIESGLSDSERRASRILNAAKEINRQPDESTAETFLKNLGHQVDDVYGRTLPKGGAARAAALDEMKSVLRTIIQRQDVWQDEEGKRLDVPNLKFDQWFETKFGNEGLTHGIMKGGGSVVNAEREKYINTALNDASGGVLKNKAYDPEMAIRLGFTTGGESAMAQAIAAATFNKLSATDTDLLGDIKSVDQLSEYLWDTENLDEERHDLIKSVANEVGNSVHNLNLWNDDDYVLKQKQIANTQDLFEEQKGQLNARTGAKRSFADLNAEAQRLYVKLHGTKLERSTEKRQQLLKDVFEEEAFFGRDYQEQKIIIDSLAMPKKFRKELKSLITGDRGMRSTADLKTALDRVDSMLKEARSEGQILPMKLQQALEKQFEDRGLLVRTKSMFGQRGSIGYMIGDEVVPQGELRYEDLVGLAGRIVEEEGLEPGQLQELSKYLSDYGKHSLVSEAMTYKTLTALETLATQLSEVDKPQEQVVEEQVVEEPSPEIMLPTSAPEVVPISSEIPGMAEESFADSREAATELAALELRNDQDAAWQGEQQSSNIGSSTIPPTEFDPWGATGVAPTHTGTPLAPEIAGMADQSFNQELDALNVLNAATGGSSDATEAKVKTATNAKGAADTMAAITVNASNVNNTDVSEDDQYEIFVKGYSDLTGKKSTGILDKKIFQEIQDLASKSKDASKAQIHKNLIQIYPKMANNDAVAEELIGAFEYVQGLMR